MNYHEDLVADFARRTRANLETLRKVQEVHRDWSVFEVTQLINSMLGLLVFPQQQYFDRIPETAMPVLVEQGWPVPRVTGNYPQANDLRTLVRYLRNAISHFNIEFLERKSGEITGIRVWNVGRNNQKTWEADLSIDDLEAITKRFIELLVGEKSFR
jgi:hypothetical protein